MISTKLHHSFILFSLNIGIFDFFIFPIFTRVAAKVNLFKQFVFLNLLSQFSTYYIYYFYIKFLFYIMQYFL